MDIINNKDMAVEIYINSNELKYKAIARELTSVIQVINAQEHLEDTREYLAKQLAEIRVFALKEIYIS